MTPPDHTADSADDKPTLADVVNGTPEGQAAAQRAMERSIEVQNDISRRAKADSAAEQRLDEILAAHHKKIVNSTGKYYAGDPVEINAREAKAALLQLIEEVANEARLDELSKAIQVCYNHSSDKDILVLTEALAKRLAALQRKDSASHEGQVE